MRALLLAAALALFALATFAPSPRAERVGIAGTFSLGDRTR